MKKLLSLCSVLIVFLGQAQDSKSIDSTAVYLMDKMSNVIGSLESVSFNISTATDALTEKGEITTYYGSSEINMTGPNKLTSITKSDNGNFSYWYDGEYVSYYSYDENNYVTLDAPETILTMIDSMHTVFDFKFPAADFFYPSFTDDIIEEFDKISYEGNRNIENESCFYITASNKEKSIQLWISNTSTMLPKRIVIVYKDQNNIQFETTFNNWVLNPNIPESIYDFTAPPNASLISILANSKL